MTRVKNAPLYRIYETIVQSFRTRQKNTLKRWMSAISPMMVNVKVNRLNHINPDHSALTITWLLAFWATGKNSYKKVGVSLSVTHWKRNTKLSADKAKPKEGSDQRGNPFSKPARNKIQAVAASSPMDISVEVLNQTLMMGIANISNAKTISFRKGGMSASVTLAGG